MKSSKLSPFKMWKSISESIENEVDSGKISKDQDFNSYMLCQIASAFPDTVHFANELNKLNLSGPMVYHFLHSVIQPKRPRYKKWVAPLKETEDEALSLIKERYKCGTETAKDILLIEEMNG